MLVELEYFNDDGGRGRIVLPKDHLLAPNDQIELEDGSIHKVINRRFYYENGLTRVMLYTNPLRGRLHK